MTPETFPSLLGLTDTDAALIAAILAHGPAGTGPVPTDLPQKRKKEIRAGFVLLKELGVVLAFTPRDGYVADYGAPRGTGEYVLNALFYYPEGSEEVEPYEGQAPFATGPVATRADALREYGEPADGEEEEGIVEWDQWQHDDHELTADYDDDGAVLTLTVASLPQG